MKMREMILNGIIGSKIYFQHNENIKFIEFEEGRPTKVIVIVNEFVEDFKKIIISKMRLSFFKKHVYPSNWRESIIYDIFYWYGFKDYELYIREFRYKDETLIKLSMKSVEKLREYFLENKKFEELEVNKNDI